MNVLGFTKRLTVTMDDRATGEYLSVRFGNVLGSRGSVLTVFRAQVETSGPITVTDPETIRYFMTVEEACQLVIKADTVGAGGEAVVLDMGEPVRIADVARRLAAQVDPPVEVVFTDLRPRHPFISHVQVPPADVAALKVLDDADAEGREQVLDPPPRARRPTRPGVGRLRPVATLGSYECAGGCGHFGAESPHRQPGEQLLLAAPPAAPPCPPPLADRRR